MTNDCEYEKIKLFIKDLKQRMKSDLIGQDGLMYTIMFAKYVDAGFQNKKIYPQALMVWPNILELSYQNYTNLGYPELFMEEQNISKIEVMFIYYFKIIYIEKLLEMKKYDLINLYKIAENEYTFSANINSITMENVELNDYIYYCKNLKQIYFQKESLSEIQIIMRKLLFVHREKFIGYEADERVDEYFRYRGFEVASNYYGCLDFNDDALFGGIAYKDYAATIFLHIGLTLKHLEFCKLHIEMHPNIKMIDIINVYHPTEDIALTIHHALNISKKTAKEIIDVLTINEGDLNKIKSTYNNSYPMFLKVSNNILMRQTLSFLVEPFMFLFQQLQNRFPRDWNRASNTRELLFRSQLYSYIPDNLGFIKINKNIKLHRLKKILTDIDALIIDKRLRTVAIFQLKWQEPFGGSPSTRNSKKNNFLETSNEWIDIVQEWLKSSTDKEKADVFGIKAREFNYKWNYKLFVIGRNFSRFSLESCVNNNACWCNWYRFISICENIRNNIGGNFMEVLYQSIIESYVKQEKEELELEKEIIELENWIFHVN